VTRKEIGLNVQVTPVELATAVVLAFDRDPEGLADFVLHLDSLFGDWDFTRALINAVDPLRAELAEIDANT
jgi:hypothetical protein